VTDDAAAADDDDKCIDDRTVHFRVNGLDKRYTKFEMRKIDAC